MNIHFVWIGKFPGAHCTATPLAAAQACPKDAVWLWVMKAHAAEFIAPLDGSKVRLMLLDSSEGPLGAQNWVAQAFEVVTTLMHYKAWAAAKDLAVLLILYNYGGLYLDTSCVLATTQESKRYAKVAGAKAVSFAQAVKGLSKSPPKLPAVKKGIGAEAMDKSSYYQLAPDFWTTNQAYQPGCSTAEACTIGYDNSVKKQYPIYEMPHVEVWSYYSPARDEVFLRAIQSYVSRAQFLGLDRTEPETEIGEKILSGRDRDKLIGHMITACVYDGFTSGGENLDGFFGKFWRATSFKEIPVNLPNPGTDIPNADILPELGVIKQYKGSWRNANAATV